MVFSETGVRGAAGPVVRNWTASNNKTEKARIGKEKKHLKKRLSLYPPPPRVIICLHIMREEEGTTLTVQVVCHCIQFAATVPNLYCQPLVRLLFPVRIRVKAGDPLVVRNRRRGVLRYGGWFFSPEII